MEIRTSARARALARDASGRAIWTARAPRFRSSNPVVATVDSISGRILGYAAGTALIIATIEGVSGQAELTVGSPSTPPPAAVATVSVTVAAPTLQVGQSTTSTAVLADGAGNTLSGRTVTWTASDPAVAMVDATTGNVLAQSPGTTQVIATSEGISGQAAVTVNVPPVASVSVRLASSTVQVGQTTTATAVLLDAAGNVLTGRTVSWSSSATAVATVNASTGVVSAVSAGAANIVATSEGVTGSAPINVPAPPAPVALVAVTLGASTLQIGQTTGASAVLRDASGNVLTGRAVTWSSSATAVAIVNASGTVTAMASGSANITATSEGVSGSATLSVAEPPPPPPPPPPPVIPAGLVFASDWHTALGNTVTAVRDGTKWDEAFNISFTPDRVSVISAAGLNFPAGMTNVLALRYPNTLNGQPDQMYSGINKQNGWDLPPVGGSLYFRMYFRFDIGGTGGGTHHPVQSCVAAGSGCGQAWMKFQKPASGESIPFIIETNGTGSYSGSAHHHIWGVTGLTRGVTYRVEEQYQRVGTNTWTVRARVYDSANNLIRSPSDFVCGFYHGGHTMGDNVQFPFGDASFLRHRTIRNQGVGGGRGSDDPSHQRIYYGGFAVSLSDWIGPYRLGESP